jgi:two-component system CheB/CheR fusion protein
MTAKKRTPDNPRGAQPAHAPEVLDAHEAATLLSAHVETVRRLARRGDIPSFKVGKDWRFKREALVRWAERQPVANQQAALMPEHDAVGDSDARPAALAALAAGEPLAREQELGSGAPPGTRRKKAPNPKDRPGGTAPAASSARTQGGSFPIVGVGASAGGLEALEQFLRPLPAQCGMAFVIVQHLDPTHKGMMAELLQRATTMKVTQVKDRQKVEPNHVYVIPPNKDMSILRGVLHLLEPAVPRGLRLPIDFFFRSLAEDQKERSIGVILSGMGSDGTLGMRAIKAQAGVGFVQAPASAKFDAMPRSVIDAGLADVVAPAEALAAKAVAYLAHVPLGARTDQGMASKTQSAIEKVCLLLRDQTGHDFSEYKRSTVYRRIERRMALHQLDSLASYVRYLSESPQEAQLLFKELLIGVTSFFRDPAAWEHLRQKVIPALIEDRPSGGMLRAWVPGCSTGEEAYSLAIVFKEALAQVKPAKSYSLQIFATDLDKDAIDKARQGGFPANIAGDVSEERLRRFFIKGEHGYQVGKEIRETVIFAPQNLIMDPPFTKLDILSCRNLLIYLSTELQKRLVPLFHYSLNPRGVLFLGSAETVGTFIDLFASLNGKARIYRRLDAAMRAEPVALPVSFFHGRPPAAGGPPAQPSASPVPNLQAFADQLLLTRYAPAAVLTNDKGDILYISGRTGKYLEPAAGKANWNIYAMAREGLRYELGAAFQRALREQRAVMHSGIKVGTDGGEKAVGVTIEPLQEPPALRGMVMVMFADEPAPAAVKPSAKAYQKSPAASVALARSEQELRETREELQSTREEMQTSQEELKSANEELQSTNEELQSGNEELTTSREEMQSLNEELQTLNHELQSKVDELTRSNNDMRNLLESTDIATLFLDDALNVRRFTSQITKIIKLIPSDAGRPLTDLSSDLVYPSLPDDAHEVLRTLSAKETAIATNDGRWFTVRVMPYRTLDNRIDGVVITFVDITTAKTLEAKLREQAGPGEAP